MLQSSDFIQAGQAFLEGLALIASPCILPVLPLMLAGSLDGGRRRPFGIITGFIATFVVFALLSRQLFSVLNVDPTLIRNVALGMLAALGIIMFSKKLSEKFFGATEGLAQLGQRLTSRWNNQNGYWGGVAIGSLVGLIWTPCAGPIMAAAIVQIIQARSGATVALTVGMFAVGAGVPMLAIALMGRQVMARFSFLKTHSDALRRVLGIVILLSAFLIYEGADVALLAATPSGTKVEISSKEGLVKALEKPYAAPEFSGISHWVNSEPLTMAQLKGKVVLVDFWTYSCINCVRTLPYMTKLDEKYRDKGLVIVGVHSPEFEFEKKSDNVDAAVKRFNIHYPVAMDNDLSTWGNFDNHYWPAHYLVNKDGKIVYTHFGEGDYDETEHNIRVLLGVQGVQTEDVKSTDEYSSQQSPETYLGTDRTENFVGGDLLRGVTKHYSYAAAIPLHHWSLSGDWYVNGQFITTAAEDSALQFHFFAKKVFLVLGSKDGKPSHLRVLLNGEPVGNAAGADVTNGGVTIDSERLYELVSQPSAQSGTLELIFDRPGAQAYAFTFGS